MNLGWCDVCLRVQHVTVTRTFYERLGFKRVDGNDDEGWAVVVRGDLRLGLYEPKHAGDHPVMLNFRGGHVGELADWARTLGLAFDGEPHVADDGSGSFTVRDPDGVALFFDAAPGETKPD